MNKYTYDKICINDIEMKCFVGVYDSEHLSKRAVFATVTLYCDTTKACVSDDIEDAVDYALVKEKVIQAVEHSSFNLVETLCSKIADVCLGFNGVEQVKVKVDKPAPIVGVKSVSVEMVRSK